MSGYSLGEVRLRELAQKLDMLEDAVSKFVYQTLQSPKWREVLIAWNQENIKAGIRPDESIIQKTPVGKQKSNMYERYTIYRRQEAGKQIEHVDLNFTGLFFESESIKVTPNAIYFIDTAPYAEKIEEVWGSVLGITQKQFDNFMWLLQPEFDKFLKNYFKSSK